MADALPEDMNEATIAGSSTAQTRQALSAYVEWTSVATGDDVTSTYAALARMEATITASTLDLDLGL